MSKKDQTIHMFNRFACLRPSVIARCLPAFAVCFCIRIASAAYLGGENSLEGDDCLGSVRQLLIDGGYSGGTSCRDVEIKLKEVGDIRIDADVYQIYDLQYRTISIKGGVSHGGQKILIFLNNKDYVGQYSLSPPPVQQLRIEGRSVFFDLPDDFGNEIRMDDSGPPKTVYIDGNVLSLYK